MENPPLRPLPKFEALYKVSPCGNVYSNAISDFIVKKINNAGYYTVTLCCSLRDGHTHKHFKRKLVHRLVAETFLEDWDNKLHVNHINGDKLDNRLSNLELVSRSQNMRHALVSGLTRDVGETHHNAILTEEQVHEICKILISNDRPYYSAIAERYGVSQSAINNIATKHRWVRVSDLYFKGKVHRLSERSRAKASSKRGGTGNRIRYSQICRETYRE